MQIFRNSNREKGMSAVMNDVKVIDIQPIEYHRQRVTLRSEKTGQEYEMIYGSSVSDRIIRRNAPFLVRRQHIKRG